MGIKISGTVPKSSFALIRTELISVDRIHCLSIVSIHITSYLLFNLFPLFKLLCANHTHRSYDYLIVPMCHIGYNVLQILAWSHDDVAGLECLKLVVVKWLSYFNRFGS